MIGRLRALARSRSGSAAVEMVVITPVVAGLLFAALDFSGAWMTRLQLEQAAQRGIEAVASKRGVQSSYAYALTEATTAWGKPYKTAVLDNWLECGGVRQTNLTASCGSTQRARYVSITMTAEYAPFLKWGNQIRGNSTNNGFVVAGDVTVRVQ